MPSLSQGRMYLYVVDPVLRAERCSRNGDGYVHAPFELQHGHRDAPIYENRHIVRHATTGNQHPIAHIPDVRACGYALE